jgi:hypothetical protein
MEKFIIALILGTTYFCQAQHCELTYLPELSQAELTCYGNDETRLLMYADTSQTRFISIECGNTPTITYDFIYDSLVIYKSIVKCQKFTCRFSVSTTSRIDWKYTLDFKDPHYTFLKIWDKSAL